jgi:hypothetical protein
MWKQALRALRFIAISALRLNVHAQVLALDSVYVPDGPGGTLTFHPLPTRTHALAPT